MIEEPASTCWDAVDAVVVINMDSRPDRMRSFMAHTGKCFPETKLHRVSAVVGTEIKGYGDAPWFSAATGARSASWAGTAGCALSHRKAVEMAQKNGWRNVLILEDDATYLPSEAAEMMLPKAMDLLSGPCMLYLGFNRPVPYGHKVAGRIGAGLWKVEGAMATHAYLVTQEIYPVLLAALPKEEKVWEWISIHRAVDMFYRSIVARTAGCSVYALFPVMFRQGVSRSDIAGRVVDGSSYSCPHEPYELVSLRGLVHSCLCPFRCLKRRLNSWYTHRRALKSGFPGYRRPRPEETE